MSEEVRPLDEAIDTLASRINRAQSTLYENSTELRQRLEADLEGLVEWTKDVRRYLGRRPRTDDTARELWERLNNMNEGDEDYPDYLHYNVELEMDHYVSAAFDGICYSVGNVKDEAYGDPLVRASSNPETAPVVKVLREIAEALG